MSVRSRAEKDLEAFDRAFLGLANDAFQESRRNRVKYAQLARQLGLTNQEIGDEYGISEAAVRQMLKRAAK